MGRGKHWQDHDQGGGGAKADPQPPPDPTIIRAVTEYRVYEGPQSMEGLVKPMTWFMTAKGLVPVRRLPLGLFIGKASGSNVPGLAELPPGVNLSIPKMAWTDLCQVVAFFRDVNAKKKAEAMVQFFWDPRANGGTGGYLHHAPTQDVSGGGVRHIGDLDKDGHLIHVLDIHSHHTMSAYWSGTDDNDEKRFEGRLYGVVGKIEDPIPEMKWRTRVGGAFLDLTLGDIIDVAAAPQVEVKRTFSPVDLLEVAGKGKDNNRFIFTYDPFEGTDYPKAWWEAIKDLPMVTRGTGGTTSWSSGHPRQMGFGGRDDHGPGSMGGGYVNVGNRVLSEAERTALKEEGLVEVRPGHWCFIPPDSPYHPQRAGLTTPSTTRPTTPSTTREGAGGGGNGSPTTSGGTDVQTSSRGGVGTEIIHHGRGHFVYDRVKGQMYRREGGLLVKSIVSPVVAAKAYPNWSLDFVAGVDEALVRDADWRH